MSGPPRGRLVALEGIDGCGKSTQCALLARALGADATFEPGATALGAALRRLVLGPASDPPAPRAEALLMAADRAQHVAEVVAPRLAAGRWVVTDRFQGSTLAYQGYGRGLDLAELERLSGWASEGVEADLSLVIDVPPEEARRRLVGAPDRLERLDPAFHRRVRHGFLALAAADPDRWAVVDGTAGVDEVAAAVLAEVTARLGRPDRSGDR